MSYILDALRRAEAERQQGQVPGLHAGAALPPAMAAPATQRAAWLGWWLLPVVLAMAVAAWWWWPQPAAAPPEARAPAQPAEQPAPAPAPAPAPLPVVVSAPPPPPATVAPAAAPPATPAAAPASAPERVVRFSELPADLQRQMPPLVPSGSVWSDQAASRFVLLNGQVTREGDTVSPGLVLERIQPKAAWLRWRGMLIELPL